MATLKSGRDRVRAVTRPTATDTSETVHACGHENVTGTHASTWELTSDDWLTPAGDCIVGVEADPTPTEFDPTFVAACRDADATIVATLGLGVEAGVSAGVILSIALHLYKTSKPHVAEVGLVPGTQHFRNILRHEVETRPHLVTLRVDESLYFANARFLEDYVLDRIAGDTALRHVVLQMTAVNEVDMSALETLEALNARLAEQGLRLHLSEVKGPVMDRLKRSHLLGALTGDVFLSQWDAWEALGDPPPGLRQAG